MNAELNLDFWGGGLGKTVSTGWRGGGLSGYEWNTFVRVSCHLESCSWKSLEKRCLFRGSLCSQLVLLVSSKRLYHIHVTWFDWFLRRKGDSTALNYHSCFHSRWPNSKTKLKWNHLWEQGAPWCSGALRSLRILCIGRIGSAWINDSHETTLFSDSKLDNAISVFWFANQWLSWDDSF